MNPLDRRWLPRTLTKRLAITLALGLGAWWISRLIQINLHLPVVLLLAVLAAPLSLVISDRLWPQSSSVVWEVQVEAGVPRLPRERRAARLADLARGAEPGQGFSVTEVRDLLADLAADRLVRHHDADPGQPFASASGLVSAPLLDYLTAAKAAPLRRTTLAAHLKEIDSL